MIPDTAHALLSDRLARGDVSPAVAEAWATLNRALRDGDLPREWRRLSSAACGRRIGRSSAYWSSLWHQNKAPAPDGRDEDDRPWWLESTIDAYLAARRERGTLPSQPQESAS